MGPLPAMLPPSLYPLLFIPIYPLYINTNVRQDFLEILKYVRPVICSKGLPGGSVGKESACNAGELCSIPGLGRSPGEGYMF